MMARVVLDREISDAELEAAIQALSEPDRLAGAQDAVARHAPRLQAVLDDALSSGGWFGQAHAQQVRQAVAAEDPDTRETAVRALVAEETRLGMLVGVAVGLELARELARHPKTPEEN
jgi:hypothetical protein